MLRIGSKINGYTTMTRQGTDFQGEMVAFLAEERRKVPNMPSETLHYVVSITRPEDEPHNWGQGHYFRTAANAWAFFLEYSGMSGAAEHGDPSFSL
jgi:hypothetical protein